MSKKERTLSNETDELPFSSEYGPRWVYTATEGTISSTQWTYDWQQMRGKWHPQYCFRWNDLDSRYKNDDFIYEMPMEPGRDNYINESMFNPNGTQTDSHISDRTDNRNNRCRCTVFLIAIGILLTAAVGIPLTLHLVSSKEISNNVVGRVSAVLTLVRVNFTEQMLNKSSAEYIVLSQTFKEETTNLYNRSSLKTSYRSCRVNSFSNIHGSVIVNYDMVFDIVERRIPSSNQIKDVLYSVDRDKNDSSLGVLGDLRFRIDSIKLTDQMTVNKNDLKDGENVIVGIKDDEVVKGIDTSSQDTVDAKNKSDGNGDINIDLNNILADVVPNDLTTQEHSATFTENTTLFYDAGITQIIRNFETTSLEKEFRINGSTDSNPASSTNIDTLESDAVSNKTNEKDVITGLFDSTTALTFVNFSSVELKSNMSGLNGRTETSTQTKHFEITTYSKDVKTENPQENDHTSNIMQTTSGGNIGYSANGKVIQDLTTEAVRVQLIENTTDPAVAIHILKTNNGSDMQTETSDVASEMNSYKYEYFSSTAAYNTTAKENTITYQHDTSTVTVISDMEKEITQKYIENNATTTEITRTDLKDDVPSGDVLSENTSPVTTQITESLSIRTTPVSDSYSKPDSFSINNTNFLPNTLFVDNTAFVDNTTSVDNSFIENTTFINTASINDMEYYTTQIATERILSTHLENNEHHTTLGQANEKTKTSTTGIDLPINDATGTTTQSLTTEENINLEIWSKINTTNEALSTTYEPFTDTGISTLEPITRESSTNLSSVVLTENSILDLNSITTVSNVSQTVHEPLTDKIILSPDPFFDDKGTIFRPFIKSIELFTTKSSETLDKITRKINTSVTPDTTRSIKTLGPYIDRSSTTPRFLSSESSTTFWSFADTESTTVKPVISESSRQYRDFSNIQKTLPNIFSNSSDVSRPFTDTINKTPELAIDARNSTNRSTTTEFVTTQSFTNEKNINSVHLSGQIDATNEKLPLAHEPFSYTGSSTFQPLTSENSSNLSSDIFIENSIPELNSNNTGTNMLEAVPEPLTGEHNSSLNPFSDAQSTFIKSELFTTRSSEILDKFTGKRKTSGTPTPGTTSISVTTLGPYIETSSTTPDFFSVESSSSFLPFAEIETTTVKHKSSESSTHFWDFKNMPRTIPTSFNNNNGIMRRPFTETRSTTSEPATDSRNPTMRSKPIQPLTTQAFTIEDNTHSVGFTGKSDITNEALPVAYDPFTDTGSSTFEPRAGKSGTHLSPLIFNEKSILELNSITTDTNVLEVVPDPLSDEKGTRPDRFFDTFFIPSINSRNIESELFITRNSATLNKFTGKRNTVVTPGAKSTTTLGPYIDMSSRTPELFASESSSTLKPFADTERTTEKPVIRKSSIHFQDFGNIQNTLPKRFSSTNDIMRGPFPDTISSTLELITDPRISSQSSTLIQPSTATDSTPTVGNTYTLDTTFLPFSSESSSTDTVGKLFEHVSLEVSTIPEIETDSRTTNEPLSKDITALKKWSAVINTSHELPSSDDISTLEPVTTNKLTAPDAFIGESGFIYERLSDEESTIPDKINGRNSTTFKPFAHVKNTSTKPYSSSDTSTIEPVTYYGPTLFGTFTSENSPIDGQFIDKKGTTLEQTHRRSSTTFETFTSATITANGPFSKLSHAIHGSTANNNDTRFGVLSDSLVTQADPVRTESSTNPENWIDTGTTRHDIFTSKDNTPLRPFIDAEFNRHTQNTDKVIVALSSIDHGAVSTAGNTKLDTSDTSTSLKKLVEFREKTLESFSNIYNSPVRPFATPNIDTVTRGSSATFQEFDDSSSTASNIKNTVSLAVSEGTTIEAFVEKESSSSGSYMNNTGTTVGYISETKRRQYIYFQPLKEAKPSTPKPFNSTQFVTVEPIYTNTKWINKFTTKTPNAAFDVQSSTLETLNNETDNVPDNLHISTTAYDRNREFDYWDKRNDFYSATEANSPPKFPGSDQISAVTTKASSFVADNSRGNFLTTTHFTEPLTRRGFLSDINNFEMSNSFHSDTTLLRETLTREPTSTVTTNTKSSVLSSQIASTSNIHTTSTQPEENSSFTLNMRPTFSNEGTTDLVTQTINGITDESKITPKEIWTSRSSPFNSKNNVYDSNNTLSFEIQNSNLIPTVSPKSLITDDSSLLLESNLTRNQDDLQKQDTRINTHLPLNDYYNTTDLSFYGGKIHEEFSPINVLSSPKTADDTQSEGMSLTNQLPVTQPLSIIRKYQSESVFTNDRDADTLYMTPFPIQTTTVTPRPIVRSSSNAKRKVLETLYIEPLPYKIITSNDPLENESNSIKTKNRVSSSPLPYTKFSSNTTRVRIDEKMLQNYDFISSLNPNSFEKVVTATYDEKRGTGLKTETTDHVTLSSVHNDSATTAMIYTNNNMNEDMKNSFLTTILTTESTDVPSSTSTYSDMFINTYNRNKFSSSGLMTDTNDVTSPRSSYHDIGMNEHLEKDAFLNNLTTNGTSTSASLYEETDININRTKDSWEKSLKRDNTIMSINNDTDIRPYMYARNYSLKTNLKSDTSDQTILSSKYSDFVTSIDAMTDASQKDTWSDITRSSTPNGISTDTYMSTNMGNGSLTTVMRMDTTDRTSPLSADTGFDTGTHFRNNLASAANTTYDTSPSIIFAEKDTFTDMSADSTTYGLKTDNSASITTDTFYTNNKIKTNIDGEYLTTGFNTDNIVGTSTASIYTDIGVSTDMKDRHSTQLMSRTLPQVMSTASPSSTKSTVTSTHAISSTAYQPFQVDISTSSLVDENVPGVPDIRYWTTFSSIDNEQLNTDSSTTHISSNTATVSTASSNSRLAFREATLKSKENGSRELPDFKKTIIPVQTTIPIPYLLNVTATAIKTERLTEFNNEQSSSSDLKINTNTTPTFNHSTHTNETDLQKAIGMDAFLSNKANYTDYSIENTTTFSIRNVTLPSGNTTIVGYTQLQSEGQNSTFGSNKDQTQGNLTSGKPHLFSLSNTFDTPTQITPPVNNMQWWVTNNQKSPATSRADFGTKLNTITEFTTERFLEQIGKDTPASSTGSKSTPIRYFAHSLNLMNSTISSKIKQNISTGYDNLWQLGDIDWLQNNTVTSPSTDMPLTTNEKVTPIVITRNSDLSSTPVTRNLGKNVLWSVLEDTSSEQPYSYWKGEYMADISNEFVLPSSATDDFKITKEFVPKDDILASNIADGKTTTFPSLSTNTEESRIVQTINASVNTTASENITALKGEHNNQRSTQTGAKMLQTFEPATTIVPFSPTLDNFRSKVPNETFNTETDLLDTGTMSANMSEVNEMLVSSGKPNLSSSNQDSVIREQPVTSEAFYMSTASTDGYKSGTTSRTFYNITTSLGLNDQNNSQINIHGNVNMSDYSAQNDDTWTRSPLSLYDVSRNISVDNTSVTFSTPHNDTNTVSVWSLYDYTNISENASSTNFSSRTWTHVGQNNSRISLYNEWNVPENTSLLLNTSSSTLEESFGDKHFRNTSKDPLLNAHMYPLSRIPYTAYSDNVSGSPFHEASMDTFKEYWTNYKSEFQENGISLTKELERLNATNLPLSKDEASFAGQMKANENMKSVFIYNGTGNETIANMTSDLISDKSESLMRNDTGFITSPNVTGEMYVFYNTTAPATNENSNKTNYFPHDHSNLYQDMNNSDRHAYKNVTGIDQAEWTYDTRITEASYAYSLNTTTPATYLNNASSSDSLGDSLELAYTAPLFEIRNRTLFSSNVGSTVNTWNLTSPTINWNNTTPVNIQEWEGIPTVFNESAYINYSYNTTEGTKNSSLFSNETGATNYQNINGSEIYVVSTETFDNTNNYFNDSSFINSDTYVEGNKDFRNTTSGAIFEGGTYVTNASSTSVDSNYHGTYNQSYTMEENGVDYFDNSSYARGRVITPDISEVVNTSWAEISTAAFNRVPELYIARNDNELINSAIETSTTTTSGVSKTFYYKGDEGIHYWQSTDAFIGSPLSMIWTASNITGWLYVILEREFMDGNSEVIAVVRAETMTVSYGNSSLFVSPKTVFDEESATLHLDIRTVKCQDEALYSLRIYNNTWQIQNQVPLKVLRVPRSEIVSPEEHFSNETLQLIKCKADRGYPYGKVVMRVSYDEGNNFENYLVSKEMMDIQTSDACLQTVLVNFTELLDQRVQKNRTLVQCGVYDTESVQEEQGYVMSEVEVVRIIPGDVCDRNGAGLYPHPYEECSFIECPFRVVKLCPITTCFDPLIRRCK